MSGAKIMDLTGRNWDFSMIHATGREDSPVVEV